MTLTAHVTIGNSDDKLKQAEWSTFVADVELVVLAVGQHLHGSWDSVASSRYQNHCTSFDVRDGREDELRRAIKALAGKYGQDSIALNLSETELITP